MTCVHYSINQQVSWLDSLIYRCLYELQSLCLRVSVCTLIHTGKQLQCSLVRFDVNETLAFSLFLCVCVCDRDRIGMDWMLFNEEKREEKHIQQKKTGQDKEALRLMTFVRHPLYLGEGTCIGLRLTHRLLTLRRPPNNTHHFSFSCPLRTAR